jgi:hypothetical protein
MIRRQRATVKRSFTIPELHLRPTWIGTHRPPSASNGVLVGCEEARPQDPAISPDAEAADRTSIFESLAPITIRCFATESQQSSTRSRT